MRPHQTAEIVAQVTQLLDQMVLINSNYTSFLRNEAPMLHDAIQESAASLQQALGEVIRRASQNPGDESAEES